MSVARSPRTVEVDAKAAGFDQARLERIDRHFGLSDRTVRYMSRNHLPGRADLGTFGRPFGEAPFAGAGFGLGFAVVEDPVRSKVLSSVGELSWGGAASTAFFIDPAEELIVVFLTQLLPSTTHPLLRSQLRQLVYQALVA